MASRDELQTLRRGLEALVLLNHEGPANVAFIARRLSVPRANAHRIINTLAAEGYCRKVPNSHLYVANVRNSGLSLEASEAGVITACAIDAIEELGRALKWPLALSMPQGTMMISRLATHLSSPLALSRITPGHQQLMLEASTGIVHLSLLEEAERARILEAIEAESPATYETWKPHLDRVLASTREDGYFIMRRTGPEASLGVAVTLAGRPVAGIAMRYIKSCVSRATAVETYLPRLRDIVREIEQCLAEANRSRAGAAPELRRRVSEETSWVSSPAFCAPTY